MSSPNIRRNQDTELNELYSTPKIALESFYNQFPEVFESYRSYYDPCNGLGDIADFLDANCPIGSYTVRGDLIDYSQYDSEQEFVQDFLSLEELPYDIDCIVFNPPYKLTGAFIDKALSLGVDVIMFNRMTTIESKSRAEKFKSREWNLKGMYQFGFRVSCTQGVDRRYTSNSVAYAWFHITQNMTKTELNWIL